MQLHSEKRVEADPPGCNWILQASAMGQVATIHRLTNGYKWGMVKNDVNPTILLGSSLPIKKTIFKWPFQLLHLHEVRPVNQKSLVHPLV
jgi:hypothetical protein